MLTVSSKPKLEDITKLGETFYFNNEIKTKNNDVVGKQTHTLDIFKANFKDNQGRYIYFWDLSHYEENVNRWAPFITPYVRLLTKLEFEDNFEILKMDPEFGQRLTNGETEIQLTVAGPRGIAASIAHTVPNVTGNVDVKKPSSRDRNFYGIESNQFVGKAVGIKALVATASNIDLKGKVEDRENPPYINWITDGGAYAKI